jgi:hypothetical protein
MLNFKIFLLAFADLISQPAAANYRRRQAAALTCQPTGSVMQKSETKTNFSEVHQKNLEATESATAGQVE